MKKLLAILLVAVMALGVLPFAASAEEATIEPYGVGMENWSNQTQLLLVASLPSISDAMAATWTITLDDGTTSKTVNLQPSSNYDFGDSAIYRFEVCLGEGANQFIPTPGTPYAVSATATIGGTDYNFTAEEGTTWTFPADQEPIVPAAPEWPAEMTITPRFGEVENWSGATFFIAGFSTAAETNAKIVGKLKDGTYAMKVVLIDETAEETHTIPKYFFDHTEGGTKEFYSDNSFLRIAFCDYGIVPVVDHAYTLQFVITEGGEVRYNATSETGAFDSFNDAFKADGAIIPEEIPHPNGGVEPEPPAGPTEIVISPFDPEGLNGFENWSEQTQLLICTTENVDEAYTWKLTIVNDETGVAKTISMKCSSAYDTWLRRFEVCLGEGENQFVPENGASYTISAEIYNDAGELVMTAAEADGFICGLDPIVPQPPVVEPPQAGDATVMIAVLAVVALFGAAVVTKKVFVK